MKRYLRYIIPAALVVILGVAVALFLILPGGENDTNPPDSTQTEQPSGTPEPVKHKLHDYFVMENKVKSISFSAITQYEGEVVDKDLDNELLALMTEDLDTKNRVTKTVNVYDLVSGEVIFTDSVTYDLGSPNRVDLSVDIDYPILRVVETTRQEMGEPTMNISYYFAKKDSSVICSASEEDGYEKTQFGNGLCAIRMADKIYWIDRDMEILRSVSQIAANGYDVDSFQSEYEGYLYAWDGQKVQVFNRLGVCSGTYQIAHDGYLNAFVLNNGNVLIQEFKRVDAYESYDVMLDNARYVVKSYVMNFIDGAMTPVALNFIVEALDTAYAQKNDSQGLPFALVEGKQNQAIIYKFAGGTVSLYQEYVVLTNDLTIEYAVENTRLGVDFFSARVIQSDLYSAIVMEGGGVQEYLFDLNGNALTPITSGGFQVSKSYIATDAGVYNHKMEKVLDLTTGVFAADEWDLDVMSDRVYLSRHNYETHADETYVLTPAAAEPVLLCDGVDKEIYEIGGGYYVLYDEETKEYRFCNLAGEVKLVVWDYYDLDETDNGMLVETFFEGRPVLYVVR